MTIYCEYCNKRFPMETSLKYQVKHFHKDLTITNGIVNPTPNDFSTTADVVEIATNDMNIINTTTDDVNTTTDDVKTTTTDFKTTTNDVKTTINDVKTTKIMSKQ